MHRSLLRKAAALAALLVAPNLAAAQSQTDLVDITEWEFAPFSLPAQMDVIIQAGNRMVDLEPEITAGFPFFGGTFVRNAGAYGKSWWWYLDQTEAQVTSRLGQHGARLIDVEPYDTANGLRYGIVLIANTGQDLALSHGWETGMSATQVQSWMSSNPLRRITDIQPYTVGGSQRYCFTWVFNAGNQASNWWLYMNTTEQVIESAIVRNDARIIDVEMHEGTDRITALLVPSDGNDWQWFTSLGSTDDPEELAEQYASRIIDFESYLTAAGDRRHAMVIRRNDTDFNVETNAEMRDRLSLGASSGFLLREIGAPEVQYGGVFEDVVFEPSTLMTTLHHYTACRRIENGFETFSSAVLERQDLNGTCPTGSGAMVRPLRSLLVDMMEQRSTTATEAVREYFGTTLIQNFAVLAGATDVALNHTIGCLCGAQRNEITLDGLAEIHDRVAEGILNDVTEDFYEIMDNSSSFGSGVFSTAPVLNQMLQSSTLTGEEISAFRASMRFAFNGGLSGCTSTAGTELHRTRGGYLQLPFRSGCNLELREYFLGAWVNDAVDSTAANDAMGAAMVAMFRDRLAEAIASWEAASCDFFRAYCTAEPNSTGSVGRCEATGSPYIQTNSLTIRGEGLPANQFGLLLYATQSGFTPGIGGGVGNLCVSGSLVRFNASIASSGPGGSLGYPLDLDAMPSTIGVRPVNPGETLFFQWWHRDVTSAGVPTSNLTRGLRVNFL